MDEGRQPRAGAREPVENARALTLRRVDAIPVALRLAKPMKMAGISIGETRNLLVRVEAADGTVGWGEAPEAPTMTGDTLKGLVAAVEERLAPAILGEDARFRPALARRMARAIHANEGARAAVDMALADLVGRAAGVPLADLHGGRWRSAVRPMWLIGNATVAEDVEEARARRRDGFAFFKLKVAMKHLEDDVAATLAVREALGAGTPLCADANTGFAPVAARRYLGAVEAADLLFLEQPLGHDDLAGMAALARSTAVPIGADEGIHSLGDLAAHADAGAAAGASLKFIKLGGVAELLEAARYCARRGLAVNIAGKTADSGIGSAAIVHAACAVPDAAWGVSLTHLYLAEDIVRRPLALDGDGTVRLPEGGGLGIDVDEAAVERCRVR
jgi:muconate cycloisomerase